MELRKEQLLIEESKCNARAFGQLFDAYYPDILKYCIRRVGDMSIAEDLTSETFIKAYKNIDTFTWQNVSISAWFYKIATNEIRMYFRNNKYSTASLDELYEKEGFEPVSEIDIHNEAIVEQDKLQRNNDFVRTQQILRTLPVKYQEVITLRFIEKKKLSEIAQILGKKEGTIKSLISRAISKLRKELNTQTVQPFAKDSIVGIEGQIIVKSKGNV